MKLISNDIDLSKEDRLYIQNFIIECCLSFPKYVLATTEYVLTIESISNSRINGDISQEEFERRLKAADIGRRNAHNRAIDACNQLNRQCKKYNIENICHADTQNRAAIADFAASFSMAMHGYALDHNYTMDEVVKEVERDIHIFQNKMIFQTERI